MRASRLLTLMILLQLRGRVSAASLARELKVSVRTIYRDVDDLSAAGVPVFAERGRQGGFALLDGFRTQLTGLTAPEADAVALIGATQAAADLGLGGDAASARLKILASLPRGSGRLAEVVAARFHLDAGPWYARRAAPAALRMVAEAVWADRQVRATYESWRGVASRTIAPLGLVMKAGAWYLLAAASGGPLIYRIAAMRDVEITGQPVTRPRHFDLARAWDEASRAFETRLHGETARVRLSPRGMRLLRDVNPAAAEAVSAQAVVTHDDGWIEASIPFERLPHAAHEALRMGAEMEVLSPRPLREAIRAEATRIARMHGSTRTASGRRAATGSGRSRRGRA